MYEKIKRWFSLGWWTAVMVAQASTKGVITVEQYNDIVGSL